MKTMIRLLFMCGISACSPVLVASSSNCEEGCTRNLTERCRSCTDGWYGPYCQKNVALNGIANQQGTWKELGAGLAVDGNIATGHGLRICAHTDSRNNSWWNVQLGDNGVNQIRYMKIYNRAENKQNLWRRRVMEILLDGKRCKKWADSDIPDTIEDVTCSGTLTGHNLTITVLGEHLSLCEVQVFVFSDGWFGKDCDKRCTCRHVRDVCDKVSGRCKLGCRDGYTGHDCKALCKDGRYGQNCASVCGHCANNVSCEKTTGHCASGCETGWEDERCDRDSSLKWPVLPMVISAVGSSIAVLIVVAGVSLCLHRQGRLLCVRKSARQPYDAVKMSDVTNQPEHQYDTVH